MDDLGNRRLRAAVVNVEGELESAVEGADRPTRSVYDPLNQRSSFVLAALNLLADAQYKANHYPGHGRSLADDLPPTSIDALNKEYDTQRAIGFPTHPDHLDGNEGYGSVAYDRDARRLAVLSDLSDKHAELVGWLDGQATRVSQMIEREPNPTDLKTLFAAGAIRPGQLYLFPDLESHLDADDWAAQVINSAAVGELPPMSSIPIQYIPDILHNGDVMYAVERSPEFNDRLGESDGRRFLEDDDFDGGPRLDWAVACTRYAGWGDDLLNDVGTLAYMETFYDTAFGGNGFGSLELVGDRLSELDERGARGLGPVSSLFGAGLDALANPYLESPLGGAESRLPEAIRAGIDDRGHLRTEDYLPIDPTVDPFETIE